MNNRHKQNTKERLIGKAGFSTRLFPRGLAVI